MLSLLTTPVPPGPLALSRLLVGTAAVIKAVVFLPRLLRLGFPDVLTSPVFEWFPAPSRGLLVAISVVWLTSAALFAVGWRVPLTGPMLATTLLFTLLLDHQAYSNHLYLMALMVVLLTLADSGAGWRFPRGPDRAVPFWGPLIIMSQISVVYLFAAVTKLNANFLEGGVVTAAMSGGVLPAPAFLVTPAAGRVLALMTIVAELLLAVGLWFPPTRKLAALTGLVLHTSILLLMRDTGDLVVFAILMWSTYPLFLRTLPEATASALAADILLEPGKGEFQAQP